MRFRNATRGCLAVIAALLLSACVADDGRAPVREMAEQGRTVEFVMAHTGGLCATDDGGALCQLALVVRDDGTWEATGTQPPAPSKGTVETGAASRLAAVLEESWEVLTARPFQGTCPSAYDGQELSYTVRRLPVGENAELADADVRELRGCAHDLEHSEARRVLERLDLLWRELGLPY